MSVTRESNVIIVGANADAIAGPCFIRSIVVKAGSDAATFTLSIGSTKIFDSGTVALGTSASFHDLNIRIQGAKTLTAGITGTTPGCYLYIA